MFSKQSSPSTEQILFAFFLLIHLLPVLWFTPFVTLDGPAHLNNAHLVRQLLAGNSTVVNHFFTLNPFPEPNWSGHAILAFLTLFIPVLIAEKIWMAGIILISVFGFRKLISALDTTSVWLSWLYFPFIYNFTFCLGFFNFAFALGILPWALYWWINHRRQPITFSRLLIGGAIAAVLYFSHLVIFLIAGAFCGVISLNDLRSTSFKKNWQQFLQLLIYSFPWLVLSFVFVYTGGTAGYRGEITYLKPGELTEWLTNARMFVVYNYADEKGITQFFTVLMLALTIIGLAKRKANELQLPFLAMLLISFLLIYFLPDSMASGGILSVRIVQLFYLFWCIWVITLRIPAKVQAYFAVVTVLFSVIILKSHLSTWKNLSAEAKNYVAAAKVIPAGSIVMPLNYSPNWLHANMCGYIGALQKVAVLDNYEATSKHFPVLWKTNMFPESVLGNYCSSNNPCIHIREYEKDYQLKVDYIVALALPNDTTDSCKAGVHEQLSSLFEPLPGWQNTDIQIFRRKK